MIGKGESPSRRWLMMGTLWQTVNRILGPNAQEQSSKNKKASFSLNQFPVCSSFLSGLFGMFAIGLCLSSGVLSLDGDVPVAISFAQTQYIVNEPAGTHPTIVNLQLKSASLPSTPITITLTVSSIACACVSAAAAVNYLD